MSAIDLILATTLTFTCQAPAVVDGDTLKDCDGRRVRIFGIQAPEARDPAGPASTAAMRALVTGQTLTCDDRGLDYFKRTVALCRLPDGRDIGAEMIRQHQATDYPKYSKGYYRGIGE